jgi:MFS family permease
VLLFLSLAMAGNYYIYDSIAPVADLLVSQLGFTDVQIGWLYSIYSVAAIGTLLIGGVIIDRIGTTTACLVFAIALPRRGSRSTRSRPRTRSCSSDASCSVSAPSRSSSR